MEECEYFGFPFHSDDHDAGQAEDGDGADDAHIVEAIVDNFDVERSKQIVERLAETDDVHSHGHSIGHSEDDTDGSAEVRTQRPRYQEVRPT